MLQHVPGEDVQQSCEGISIRVKDIELRSYNFWSSLIKRYFTL